MADKLERQPRKGILKNSSSFETAERQRELSKETKWDEMNIIATYHPKDKDYGHMKIEEPKTPYAYEGNDSGDELDGLDTDLLASKIKSEAAEPLKAHKQPEVESSDEEESPEERAKRKVFETKRKQHYKEYYAVKLARKLMEKDEEEEDDKEESENVEDKDEQNQEETNVLESVGESKESDKLEKMDSGVSESTEL